MAHRRTADCLIHDMTRDKQGSDLGNLSKKHVDDIQGKGDKHNVADELKRSGHIQSLSCGGLTEVGVDNQRRDSIPFRKTVNDWFEGPDQTAGTDLQDLETDIGLDKSGQSLIRFLTQKHITDKCDCSEKQGWLTKEFINKPHKDTNKNFHRYSFKFDC
jgi:hypothetical protein